MWKFASQVGIRTAVRAASTSSQPTKVAGDISSVFPSLRSDYKPEPLPKRFEDLKLRYFLRNGSALKKSWVRLLASLEHEVEEIRKAGSDLGSDGVGNDAGRLDDARVDATCQTTGIPSINFSDILSGEVSLLGRIPISFGPSAFCKEFGIFRSQNTALHDLPSSYADRFRIRNPGDAKFALGPHIDGGSLERWEDPEYSSVYQKILDGSWEEYDPFDARHRVHAKMDLYNGAGACSMLRFFQGWLSMSDTGPGEGTLHVCPMLKSSTAYTILRPFFDVRTSEPLMDSSFPGSVPGVCQEYSDLSHPHLKLSTTMVSVPRVEPGDYVAWHCDCLHSVDNEHRGKGDSSVLYIPAAPLCEMNARYLQKQRQAALTYSPPWDYPNAGGPGEFGFAGAVDWSTLSHDGLQAMGMGDAPWQVQGGMSQGEREAIEIGNKIVFENNS
ncbi:DUF1479 domain-containing protein [Histoplasma capsulatum H143]|uniref:DUF1479 domain-containing protein n=1 Tax=Ajellomyces capsulatus (strain H143) TaxID=544712 RepID=C6HER2_AJECH|nr:DUF1479 domain-containing protein [Histoplasma capsulatum H143]